MDFFELNAFVTLSRTLHFAHTAAEVNLSPSALSRLVSRLEEETGTVLLDRNNREVSLTTAGAKFAEFAKSCIAERDDMLLSFKNESDEISGNLRVYASVTACYSIVPPFLKKLAEKYPRIHLSIETGDPAGAILAVREDRADVAVAAIPENGVPGLDSVPVRRTPLVFAASVGGPYADVKGSPQDIISSVPLILPKTGIARERFEAWTHSRNVHPIVAAETEGNEAIMALVQLGLGIGLVPQIVLTNGPYINGFTSYAALNSLGYYEVGFIQKIRLQGTESYKRMRNAVSEILHE